MKGRIMKRINSEKAPKAIGPYVHATSADNILITSGQIGLDASTNELKAEFADQVKQALDNLEQVLLAGHSDLAHVLKATVYLTDMGKFAEFNTIYADKFGESYPARTAIQVSALPLGAQVEIEAIAERKVL